MYRAEELNKSMEYLDKIIKIFELMDTLGGETISQMNFLQRFGAMHMGALLDTFPKCRFLYPEECGPCKLYNTVEDLIESTGLPADWAFTVYNLFFPLHSFLKKKEMFDADLFRDFIFQNYAYKLRGVKRVAFMANFFASMHYDFTKIEDMKKARNLSQYVITKFGSVSESEFRIYATFTRLIMADVETQVKADDSAEECIKLFRDAKLQDNIEEDGLLRLWSFLVLYEGMIKHNRRLDLDKLMHQFVMVAECRGRWKKAICVSRHYEQFLRQDQSLFVETWHKRLHGTKLFHKKLHNVFEC